MLWIEKKYLQLAALLFIQIALIGIGMFFLFRSVEKRFVQEVKRIETVLFQIKENEVLLSVDLNQTRALLGLQEKVYPLLKDPLETSKLGSDPSSSPLYRALTTLLSHNDRLHRQNLIKEAVEEEPLRSLLQKNSLSVKRSDSSFLLEKKGVPYFFLLFTGPSGIKVETYAGDTYEPPSHEHLALPLADFIQEHVPKIDMHMEKVNKLRREFLSILEKPAYKTLASSKGLISSVTESTDTLTIKFSLKAEPALTKVEVSFLARKGTFKIGDKLFSSTEDLEKELELALREADTKNSRDLRNLQILTNLRNHLKDESFQTYLASKKLKIAQKERDTEEYILIDIQDAAGKKVGSIGLLKNTSEVYLFDKDQVPLSSLRLFTFPSLMGDKKKTLNPPSP
ncbi:MAG: hypothetical protein SNJ78_06830 [Spirochaetales bacterium]